MKVPLAEMARRLTNRPRKIVFPPIVPTKAQADRLARAYVKVLNVWAVAARDRILPAYGQTIAQMARDSVTDIQLEIERAEQNAVRATVDFSRDFTGWANDMQSGHLNKVIAQVKYATGVDVSAMLIAADERLTVEQALARNVALVRDVSDQARARISDIVFRGMQSPPTPMREVARQIAEATGLGRARSLRIASDQTVKLSAAFDQDRQRQLGIEVFEWRHSGKVHYRPWHKERNGKHFRWDSKIGKEDPPGWEPFCGCKALGVLDTDVDVGALPPTPRRRVPLIARPKVQKQIEPPKPAFRFQAFTPAKTMDEAKAWAKENVADNIVTSKGASVDGLNKYNQAALEVMERFDLPKMKFYGDPTGIIFNIAGRRIRVPFGSRAAALYSPDIDAVMFRKLGLDDKQMRDIFADNLARSGQVQLTAARQIAEANAATIAPAVKVGLAKMEARTWVVSGGAKETAYHELGHRLHMRFHKDEINAALDMGKIGREGWSLLLSKYAETNRFEFVAESFALYMESPAQHFRIFPPLLELFRKYDRMVPK